MKSYICLIYLFGWCNIQCYNHLFKIESRNGQRTKTIFKNESENESEEEAVINYDIYTNDGKYIGDDIDFINKGYLNEKGTCFYLIENPNFFKYLKNIFPDVNISNSEIFKYNDIS